MNIFARTATTLFVSVSLLLGGMALAADPGAKQSPVTPSAEPATQESVDAAKKDAADIARAEERQRKAIEAKEARRLAAIEQEKERKARQEAWEQRCVIKPAMSDEEIAICREVRTKPAP